MRPEQLLTALPCAMRAMTDRVDCGPVTLAFCQDVRAEAFDWPEAFFAPRQPDPAEVQAVAGLVVRATRRVIVAGGGVHYGFATTALRAFAEAHQIAVAETQVRKSALPWNHPLKLGPVGVTGAFMARTCRCRNTHTFRRRKS